MANVIITIRIMPESTNTDLKKISQKVKNEILVYGGEIGKEETEPVAFGLKSLKIIFILDESKGIEELENKFKKIKNVSSIKIIDVRRAIG